MASASLSPADSAILREHPALRVTRGPYTYSVDFAGNGALLSVSDAHGKITEPVLMAVGAGLVHQSYLIEHQGGFYQPPISYYTSEGKLLAPGDAVPASLEAALGQRLPGDRLPACSVMARPRAPALLLRPSV